MKEDVKTKRREEMADEITQKVVQMTVADYRNAANEAREYAVALLRHEPANELGAGGRMLQAAEFLRAADTFNGHANVMEMFGPAFDGTMIEVYPECETA